MLTSTTQDWNKNDKIKRSIAISLRLISNPNPCILFKGGCEITPEVPTSSSGLAPVPSSPGLYRSVVHVLHVVSHVMFSHLPICPFELGLTKLVSCFFGSDAIPSEVWGCGSNDPPSPSIVETLVRDSSTSRQRRVEGSWHGFVVFDAEDGPFGVARGITFVGVAFGTSPSSGPSICHCGPCFCFPGQSSFDKRWEFLGEDLWVSNADENKKANCQNAYLHVLFIFNVDICHN